MTASEYRDCRKTQCTHSSIGQSIGLRNRRLEVRALLGVLYGSEESVLPVCRLRFLGMLARCRRSLQGTAVANQILSCRSRQSTGQGWSVFVAGDAVRSLYGGASMVTQTNLSDWYSVPEAAKVLGLKNRRVRALINQDRIKAVPKGVQWIIHHDELMRFKAIPREVGNPDMLAGRRPRPKGQRPRTDAKKRLMRKDVIATATTKKKSAAKNPSKGAVKANPSAKKRASKSQN